MNRVVGRRVLFNQTVVPEIGAYQSVFLEMWERGKLPDPLCSFALRPVNGGRKQCKAQGSYETNLVTQLVNCGELIFTRD